MKSAAYLLIGEDSSLEKLCKRVLMNVIPQVYKGEETSAYILWVQPMKGMYKKQDVEYPIELMRLHHTYESPLCIVFRDAHKFPDLVANSLLKILEELPDFLYVLLLTPSKHSVLPTIVSRCIHIQETCSTESEENEHPLVVALLRGATTPAAFEEIVVQHVLDERTSELLVLNLASLILHKHPNNPEYQKIIERLMHLLRYALPVSNSLIFWRAVFVLIRSSLFRT